MTMFESPATRLGGGFPTAVRYLADAQTAPADNARANRSRSVAGRIDGNRRSPRFSDADLLCLFLAKFCQYQYQRKGHMNKIARVVPLRIRGRHGFSSCRHLPERRLRERQFLRLDHRAGVNNGSPVTAVYGSSLNIGAGGAFRGAVVTGP